MHILLVEDNHDVSDNLQIGLQVFGHTVDVVHAVERVIEEEIATIREAVGGDEVIIGLSGESLATALADAATVRSRYGQKTEGAVLGYIRSDDSGHRYLVPEDIVVAFDALLNQMGSVDEDSERFYDLCDDFERDYGKYRLDGGVENLKVLMEG